MKYVRSSPDHSSSSRKCPISRASVDAARSQNFFDLAAGAGSIAITGYSLPSAARASRSQNFFDLAVGVGVGVGVMPPRCAADAESAEAAEKAR